MKKKDISPAHIWGNRISSSDWLRWYINYRRLTVKFLETKAWN